jgi:hypothetical protein
MQPLLLPDSSLEAMYVHVVLDAMRRGYSSQHNKLGMIGELTGAGWVQVLPPHSPPPPSHLLSPSRPPPPHNHPSTLRHLLAVEFCGDQEADSVLLSKAQQYIDQGVSKVCLGAAQAVGGDAQHTAACGRVWKQVALQNPCSHPCAHVASLLRARPPPAPLPRCAS